ncbi:hypothetical protein HZ326_19827 [Fusarium oxysporum f. sp. albedinis]|nr:hypothetical protein HZ326_19827 [Fusarium oxysporum f. sp. albedinis]
MRVTAISRSPDLVKKEQQPMGDFLDPDFGLGGGDNLYIAIESDVCSVCCLGSEYQGGVDRAAATTGNKRATRGAVGPWRQGANT